MNSYILWNNDCLCPGLERKSIANFAQLQNDCQSPWGDFADEGQAGLREQGENFHLKLNHKEDLW